MNSHQELLEMVATQAAEDITARDQYQLHPRKDNSATIARTVEYNLRLVSHPDGRMEWKD